MSLSLITLIICPAMILIMFLYLKWYIKNRTSASGVLKETKLEVQNWIKEATITIADINTVTDRNLQLIEDKISKLNGIMEEAGRRIAEYKEDAEKIKESGQKFARESAHPPDALYTQLGRGVRAAVNKESAYLAGDAPKLSVIHPGLPGQTEFCMEQSEVSGSPSKKTAASLTPATPAPPAKKENNQQIREQIDKLAEDGLSPGQIASQLGISKAEVEIAISLRR